jgi:hypothetical protein
MLGKVSLAGHFQSVAYMMENKKQVHQKDANTTLISYPYCRASWRMSEHRGWYGKSLAKKLHFQPNKLPKMRYF